MTDPVKALLARLEEQRKHWCDLPDGKRLRFLRPPEVELPRFIAGVTVDHVVDYACDWDKFSEADLLGNAALGSSDPLPFHRDLWAAAARDNTDYVKSVADAMAAVATRYLEEKAEAQKNSQPSSTPATPS